MHTTKTQFNQLIERMAYPTDTHAIIAFVRQHGTGDAVVDMATKLPNRSFANVGEIRAALETLT